MDKETRPAKQGGNHNKHHRRKPYYIKKKNDTVEGGVAVEADSLKESVKETVSTSAPTTEANARPNGEKRNRRDRHKGRRGHGDKRDRNSAVNEPASDASLENNTAVAEEWENSVVEDTVDETPEIVIAIEDEIVEVEDDSPRVHVTGVRFKPGGKIYYFDHGELKIKNNDYVIVDTARGLEFGEVAFGDKTVKESSLVLPLRQVVRVATRDDIERNAANKEKEVEAFAICQEKIRNHELDMKLIEAQ